MNLRVIPVIMMMILVSVVTACNGGNLNIQDQDREGTSMQRNGGTVNNENTGISGYDKDFPGRTRNDIGMNPDAVRSNDYPPADWRRRMADKYSNDTRTFDVNPNMVTGRNTDLYNLYAEADILADTAAAVDGVERARVWINGGTVWVTLNFEDQIRDRSERNRIRENVLYSLQRKMPRYRFRIVGWN